MKAKAKAGGHDEDIDKKFEAIVKKTGHASALPAR